MKKQNKINIFWQIKRQSGISDIIKKACDFSLLYMQTLPCEINVTITNGNKIRQINNEYRQKDKPTDVLTFPMVEIDKKKPFEKNITDADIVNGRVFLGDMLIALDIAQNQATEYNHSLVRELSFLCVHSVLHFLGYDHELSKLEQALHFELQTEILLKMGMTRDD